MIVLGILVDDAVVVVEAGCREALYARRLACERSTRAIGETALAMMLERIARPGLPPRDVRRQCELAVRDSCGASS